MRRNIQSMAAKRSGVIPDDCYEVDWLGSTGTQYIDTGIPWDSSLNISAEFSPLENSTIAMYCLWGARDSTSGSQGNCFGLSNTGKFRSDNNGTRITSSASYAVGGHYTVTKDGSTVTIGGDATDSMTAALNPAIGVAHITLFSLNENGDATKYRTKFRLYSFAVRGRLDLIPVRRVEGGVSVGYLCDRLTGQLYGNAGSGSFIIGPDVVPSRVGNYVQDGLVAMWDGIENAGFGLHDESATYWKDLISGLRMSALSDSYYRPADRYGSFTTQCTQTIPKELWGGDQVKNITQSALVDMDSVASNSFFTLLYCYASPAAYRYGVSTNASRRLTGDHLTMLSAEDSALYTQGIHRFDHIVTENTSGGTDEKLYIDGVEIVSARKTTAFSATETTQMRFYFFANIRAYNMMQYSRPLTPAEIAANFAVDKARFGI